MIILRWLLNSAFLILLAQILPGFQVASIYSALLAAFFIGILNAVARPILILLTLPVNFVTLGLFTFIINALLILFVASFLKGFNVESFQVAILAGLSMWLFSFFTNYIFKDNHKNIFWRIRRNRWKNERE